MTDRQSPGNHLAIALAENAYGEADSSDRPTEAFRLMLCFGKRIELDILVIGKSLS